MKFRIDPLTVGLLGIALTLTIAYVPLLDLFRSPPVQIRVQVLDEDTRQPLPGCSFHFRKKDIPLGDLPALEMHGVYIQGGSRAFEVDAAGFAEFRFDDRDALFHSLQLKGEPVAGFRTIYHRDDGVDLVTENYFHRRDMDPGSRPKVLEYTVLVDRRP